MNNTFREMGLARKFARLSVISLVAALFTVPTISASNAAVHIGTKGGHPATRGTHVATSSKPGKLLGARSKSGNKFTSATTYDTAVDQMQLVPAGTTPEQAGNWYNIQLDNWNPYVGGAYLALTPDSSQTIGSNPTWYPYATENTLVVERISSVYGDGEFRYKCLPFGSLFPNTTHSDYRTAVSKVPFLYDPALAGKMVELWVWNEELGVEYTTDMSCDISNAPLDGNSSWGPHYLLQDAFSAKIYYAGLTSDNPSVSYNSQSSLPKLPTVANGGATFTWNNPTAESLTVVTMAHQNYNSYGGDSWAWTGPREYDATPGSVGDTPTVVACFAAKDLHSHTFGVTGNNFVLDGTSYEYMAANRPQVQITVMDNAYVTPGASCLSQYTDAFIGLGTGDSNSHPPEESFTLQLPVAVPNSTTVNPGETLTFTTINPDYNDIIMGNGSLEIYTKQGNAADDTYSYWDGQNNSNLYDGYYSWSDFVDCSNSAGVDVKFNIYADGSLPNDANWDTPASSTFTIHFTPQDSAICQNSTPIPPDFNAEPAVNAESITTTSANNYLVILPNSQDTLRFNPLPNTGRVTEAWYNDFQTIETATVDGEPMSWGDMPVDIDLTNEPHIQVVDYYVVSPDGLHSTHVTYTFAHTPPIPGPTVSGISPASGPAAGGQSVTIGGGTFLETPTVTVGGVACVVTAFTATTVTCTTGAHAPGNVSIAVSNPGTLTTTLPNAYTYISSPTIGSITPNHGPMVGGTGITIEGSGFIAIPTILIGGVPCTDVYFGGSGYLECYTGAAPAGLVDVTITNSDSGTVTATNAYTYDGPTIGSIDPNHGPMAGGTTITINGTGFANGTTITVGGAPCTSVVVVSSTQITCVTPEHSAGTVDVVLTVPDFGTTTGSFTYDGPTAPNIIYNKDILNAGITLPSGVTVNPAANPAQGVGVVGINDVVVHVPFGTDITSLPFTFTITAPDLMLVGPVLQVSGVTKNNFTTPITYTVTAPDGTTKNYTVTVVVDPAPAGTPTTTPTPVTPAPATEALSVGGISPKAGPVTGGTTVTVSGTGFTSGTSVTIGGAACSPVTVISSTQISCVTSAHAAGAVDVVVSDAGKSATAAGAYTYADGTVQLGPLPANAGLQPGTTYVTVDGVPYQINVAPNGDANAIQLTATDWNLKLQAKGENGQPLALDDQNRIIVDPGLAAAFTGTGFMPNSDVYVYAFSDPKFMGVIRTDKNGNFTSSLAVPDLATGGHTIQLNGLSPKGEVRSASVGVVVQPKTTVASGKVYFAYASSVLDAKAKATIAAIVKKAKAAKGNVFITIVGWAQPTANSKHHVALSNARAAAVASALKAAGVKGSYTVSGKGLATANVPASRYAEITVQVARK